MWQNPEHQSGNFLSTMPTAGYSVPLSSMAAEAKAIHQQPGFPNPAFEAVPVDQRTRVLESSGTCNSNRPKKVSTMSGCSFSQELLSQIRDHSIEIDTLLDHYKNMLREGIGEAQMRHCKSLLSILEQIALKRILEKDAELEKANRKNSELEETISQLCSENQILLNLAIQNEALASSLKATLEEFLTQNKAAEAGLVIEGYGDTDGTPLHANDEQSCYKVEEAKVEINEKVCRRMVCKVCQEKEISVLVLHCRHLCLCKECETKVEMCPICNRWKKGSVQIFMP